MCWHSCVIRCAGSTGSVVGVSSSPGILRGSPYTSSATDVYRSTLKDVQIPRRVRRSTSVQCRSAWHMMVVFSVWLKHSKSPLAAG
jgi:hypothetical protein